MAVGRDTEPDSSAAAGWTVRRARVLQMPDDGPFSGASPTGEATMHAHREATAVTATRCFVQATGALVLLTIGRQAGLLGPPALAIGMLCGALVLIAWSAGATLADLGLDPAAIPAGLRYGAGAFVVVLMALAAAALVPAA